MGKFIMYLRKSKLFYSKIYEQYTDSLMYVIYVS